MLYKNSNELIDTAALKQEITTMPLNLDLIEEDSTSNPNQLAELKLFEFFGDSLTVLEPPYIDFGDTSDPFFNRIHEILQSRSLSVMLNTDICQSYDTDSYDWIRVSFSTMEELRNSTPLTKFTFSIFLR